MLHTLTIMGPHGARAQTRGERACRAECLYLLRSAVAPPASVPDRFPRRDSTRTTRLLPDAALGVATPLIITG